MAVLKMLGGAYLIAVAAVVAAWFITNSFFVDSFDVMHVWHALNILMVVGLPLALDFNFRRKLREGGPREPGTPVTRRYLEANIVFFLTAAVAILFLHNWFSLLALGEASSLGESANLNHQTWVIWAVVDTLLPITFGITGCALWRDARES